MENVIETFRNQQFGDIRVILVNDDPWFLASDICKALDIRNPSDALKRLDNDEKNTLVLTYGIPGNPAKTVVNEYGLYALVLGSRKPEAKTFKRWITHEVLPCIRKTGGYMTDSLLQRIQQDPSVIYEFANALLAERKRSDTLASELSIAKPKADYFDAFVNPDDCTNIRTTAKELNIPERKFVKFLLKEQFLFRSRSYQLLPYNKPSNKGLFIVRDYPSIADGVSQTYFTPMGKDVIRLHYIKVHGALPPVSRGA